MRWRNCCRFLRQGVDGPNLPDLDAMEVAEQIRSQFLRIAVELVDSRGECTGAAQRGLRGEHP
jgi:hypothetical protein